MSLRRKGGKLRAMWLVWAISIGVWTCIALALGTTQYLSGMPMGTANTLASALELQFSDCLAYLPLTPFAYRLARRHPMQRANWPLRVLQLLGGAALFSLVHILIRGLTPYADWTGHWRSAVTWSRAAIPEVHWAVYAHMLIVNSIQDLIFVYVPIVSIGVAVAYHQSFRQNELRKSQLESHLAVARLEALKSQLRPHFLFNTLHSISSLMFTDVGAADQMMTLLSDLLRLSLRNDGSQVTTLREELQFVDTYLEIESIRFESRLTIERDIEPETLNATVPHLLLQPLVENAIRHGIAPLESGGRVRIASSRSGQSLMLQITDNGPGLATQVLEASRPGLGLRTTRERLRTLYGDDQRMEIRVARGGGVDILLTIPLTQGSTRYTAAETADVK